jgi:glycine dehydrogenase subunit 2
VQGALEILHEVARALAALTGLDRFSLQPPSLGVAERAAVRLAVASFARTQPARTQIVAAADSRVVAHAGAVGLAVRTVPRLPGGDLDTEGIEAAVGEATALVAASWLTPAGRLDRNLAAAGHVAHAHGALFGVDATGLARLAGHTRLREGEADLAWLSLAELCPVATGAALGVRSPLTQCLPTPLVSKERSGYGVDDELPGTIGPLALTAARLADALPLYVLLRTLGETGLRLRAMGDGTPPVAP